VPDAPGVSELVPELAGLRVVSRTDRQALTREGKVVRSATFTFATAKDAAEAQKRGAGDDYQGQLERAFPGETVGRGPGVGVRLRVPRATGTGSDLAEIYLLTSGRRLTVAELVSARIRSGAASPRPSSAQSQNSGRMNSSKVSRSQLATTDGVSARTEAVRGMSIANATSPK
jgi:hypothetical protein